MLENSLFDAGKLAKNAHFINILILDMVLDLMYAENFYYSMVVGLVKIR